MARYGLYSKNWLKNMLPVEIMHIEKMSVEAAQFGKLKVVYENASGGFDCRGIKPKETPTKYSLPEYIEQYKRHNPDILCLVETHAKDKKGNSQMVSEIAEALHLPHVKNYAHSPSHLDSSKFLGTAVLSSYPLIRSTITPLPNPNLTVMRPNGQQWQSHDKYIQETMLNVRGKPIRIKVFQGLPFHEFDTFLEHPNHEVYRREVSTVLSVQDDIPTIVVGDFNNHHLDVQHAFPGFIRDDNLQEAVKVPTTHRFHIDDQSDHIFYTPKSLVVASSFAELNLSDHYTLIAEFFVKP